MIRNAVQRLLVVMGLFVLATGCVEAQGQAACQTPDPQLSPVAIERWLGQHASPHILLEATARAASSPLWMDEVAISAGRALIKGHVDGPNRAAELQAFVRRLQAQSDAVRRTPDVTWLDDKGMPSSVASTASFLFQLEGVPQSGQAAGRSALTCELVDRALAEFAMVAVMNGTQITRLKPRGDLALESGLPVLSIDVTVSGRYLDLLNLLRTWQGLPFPITLDGVVMAPLDEQLQMALTIKVIRGVARLDGPLSDAARVGGLNDPFRRSEKVLADRRAASPLPACAERAKLWASQGENVAYRGALVMPGNGFSGLFRVGGGGMLRFARAGEAMVDVGARVVTVSREAAELEVAEQVGDTCQLRTVKLRAQTP